MIGIVMKTISILCLHNMFLPLKMCNASEKCHLKWNKTNYAVYLGFHESEGLAVLTDTICVILWKPVRYQLRLSVTQHHLICVNAAAKNTGCIYETRSNANKIKVELHDSSCV